MTTRTTTATVKSPRTYQQWLMTLVSIGQTYGIDSYQWKQTLTAASRDLLFRTWALRDAAITAIKAVRQ